ncbi:MAG: stage II sporulation protein M [Ardenticatenaceae bacterium]|nr:stage II sporulation protein M [Ardenticatenaceae bacterium]
MNIALSPSLSDLDGRIVASIVRREVRDSLRDWRIILPVFSLTAVFPFLMNFTAGIVFDFLRRYNAVIIGEHMIPFGALVVGFFPITFSLVIGLETFVGEKERNSLEALLATPASDTELYLGKLLAALLLPVASSIGGIGVYLVSLWLTRAWLPNPELLAQIFLLTILEGLVMVSGAVVVSSHTTSVRAANLLASFIIVPMTLLLQVEAVMMFWGAYQSLWHVALGLIVVDVILVRAGLRTFNRENILARELGQFNPHRLVDLWLAFFRLAPDEQAHPSQLAQDRPVCAVDPDGRPSACRPFSLCRVYRHDLPLLVVRGRPAIATTVVVLIAGVALGLVLAATWPLPHGLITMADFNTELFKGRLAAGTPGWSLLPEFSAVAVFGHNVRALLLAALLSVLSFGSLALLLLLAPIGIISFLAGQIALVGEDPLRFLVAFILPHGIVELPAAVLATAFALRLGAVLIAPPAGFTAGEGLLQALADFVKVFLFLIAPLLLIAALLEIYLTPQIVIWLYR